MEYQISSLVLNKNAKNTFKKDTPKGSFVNIMSKYQIYVISMQRLMRANI